MQLKKIVLVSAISLVVLGCVLAAGCTSNTTTQQTISDDKIVGNWTFPYDNGEGVTGIGIDVIKKDGTGFTVVTSNEGKRILKYNPYTWKKNNDGTYTFTFANDNTVITMTYDSSTDTYIDKNRFNVIHKRLDPITGIWFTESKDKNDIDSKVTHIILQDGTGYGLISRVDGTTEIIYDTWKKNSDGTYTVASTYGDTNKWTFDPTKGEFKSDSGRVFTKKFADSYYYLSILGPWYNAEKKKLAFFNADGTGIYDLNTEIENFTWAPTSEFGKIKLHVLDGIYKGNDYIWEYDRVNNTLYTPDGNETYVRPSENINRLTISKTTTSNKS